MKKILNFKIKMSDYGSEIYDANLYPFEGYEILDDYQKITMLYAIKEMINSEIFDLEQKPL